MYGYNVKCRADAEEILRVKDSEVISHERCKIIIAV